MSAECIFCLALAFAAICHSWAERRVTNEIIRRARKVAGGSCDRQQSIADRRELAEAMARLPLHPWRPLWLKRRQRQEVAQPRPTRAVAGSGQ